MIAELYEKFFKIGFAKQADQLGIVYTPVEIVDFILRAADQASRDAFGRGLTDEGVTVLDPFTGTGTFITRLLQSGLIKPEDLARKYASELYANDIMLLAYYVAAVNIETTYHALTGANYAPFQGIVLADTFQIAEADDSFDAVVFPQNNDRINRELAAPIDVVVGNPPYSVGQSAANDLNANVAYPTLDKRITDTYAKRSTAQNKNSLYDSYLRAFRWATDRIGDRGVVAFVSNGGWIDGNTADGIRLSLADEYARLYIYNLRGNQRTAGELSRKEGGKVFGGGSRNTVAILIGVKDPDYTGACVIHYHDIGDYLTREDKLRLIADGTLDTVDWRTIAPNAHGDWVSQRDDAFASWPAIGGKPVDERVFDIYSAGLKSGRDAWCYNSSLSTLRDNIARTIAHYNSEVERIAALRVPSTSVPSVDRLLRPDSTQFSWDHINKKQVVQGVRIEFRPSGLRTGTYRPFFPQHLYIDERQQLSMRTYQLPSIFPTAAHTNVGIVLTGPASHFEFTPFMTDLLPNLHVLDTAQFFPRWRYEKAASGGGVLDIAVGAGKVDEHGYRRIDNITDVIVERYEQALGVPVSRDDIFYSVYGQLHDPAYRTTYAADLRKMLPHIPTPSTRARFDQLAVAGRALAELHVHHDAVEPHPGISVQLKPEADPADRETWRVAKMKWKTKGDHTTIAYNPQVTITGIPEEAERYQLGSRSALGWLIDRWQHKVDKPSGIVNDPNDWCDEHDDPQYIVNLIKRVATVAVETMAIVDKLALEPIEDEARGG